ncbi:GTP pyrophosphokinase family protein [Streptomyces sp. NPDC056194]|uniref:GTP pyrophosphokinase n=1 Tax=unclassified Streptomyces TaxID=2593676 RepID=UPI0035DC00D4
MFGDDIPRGKALQAYQVEFPKFELYSKAVQELATKLCDLRGIKFQTIEARAKDVASLEGKLERHPGYQWLSDAEDLCGVRVVTFYLDDVTLVRDMIREEFDILKEENRRADAPDAFGYQSLHIIARLSEDRRRLSEYQEFADFRVEFQVRTVLQHAWGVISHALDYKNEKAIPAVVRRKLFRLAALLETGDELFGAFRAEVETLRASYAHQVNVEEWRELPLNFDSVQASWQKMPLPEVSQVARAVGFADDEESPHHDDQRFRQSLNSLVSLATTAGLTTVGALADLMASLSEQSERLSALVREIRANGLIPVGDPCDVIALSMLLRDPELRVHGTILFQHEIEDALDATLHQVGP